MAADEETTRQLAELREELAARRKIRTEVRRRLDVLEEQAARLGIEAPPQITTEIADLNIKRNEIDAEIGEIDKRIARLELAPTPAAQALPPSNGGGSPYPHLIPAVVDSRLQAVERASDRNGEAISDLVKIALRLEGWMARSDALRDEGQRTYRLIAVAGFVALIIVVIGMVLIAIKVY